MIDLFKVRTLIYKALNRCAIEHQKESKLLMIYDGHIILPKGITLSDSAWSELIQQISGDTKGFPLHSLQEIVNSPVVPDHLKTADLKNHISWLRFECDMHSLTKFVGSHHGGCYELRTDAITKMYEWLLKPEQAAIRSRAAKRIAAKLEEIKEYNPPSMHVQQWIEKILSLDVVTAS